MPVELPSWLSPGAAAGLVIGVVVLLLVAVRLVLLLRDTRRLGNALSGSPYPADRRAGESPPAPASAGFSTIVVDGRAVTSLDQVPPSARQTVEKIQALMVDADRDGIPDAFEQGGLGALLGSLRPGAVQVQAIDLTPDGAPGDRTAERLEELKGLLDRGLITAADYEAKKREILAGL